MGNTEKQLRFKFLESSSQFCDKGKKCFYNVETRNKKEQFGSACGIWKTEINMFHKCRLVYGLDVNNLGRLRTPCPVSVMTRLRAGRPEVQIPAGTRGLSHLQNVQTVPLAHAACSPMITGVYLLPL